MCVLTLIMPTRAQMARLLDPWAITDWNTIYTYTYISKHIYTYIYIMWTYPATVLAWCLCFGKLYLNTRMCMYTYALYIHVQCDLWLTKQNLLLDAWGLAHCFKHRHAQSLHETVHAAPILWQPRSNNLSWCMCVYVCACAQIYVGVGVYLCVYVYMYTGTCPTSTASQHMCESTIMMNPQAVAEICFEALTAKTKTRIHA